MKENKILDILTFWLVLIGAINWGLFGLFNFDLVAFISTGILGTIIYTCIGFAGIYMLWTFLKQWIK